MARYAHLYSQAMLDLEKTRKMLADTIRDRDSYRDFINESGKVRDYMIWWARKQGFQEDAMKSLENAFAGADEQSEGGKS